MQLTNFSIMRRKPMEQYGHEEITIHGTFDKEEKPEQALMEAKSVVVDVLYGAALPKIEKSNQPKPSTENISEPKLGGTPVSNQEAHLETKSEDVAPPKAEKKTRKPKTEAAPQAPAVEDQSPTTETEEPAKTEATTAPKKMKKAGTVYNREIDLHKKLVGELLDKEFPGWKKNTEKAKAVSVKMAGKPFMDAEGRILESFKEEFKAEYQKA